MLLINIIIYFCYYNNYFNSDSVIYIGSIYPSAMKILVVTTIILVFTILISNYVYAHHYSGYRWLLTYTNVCYDVYSLSLVNINGNTNRFNIVASEIDQARNDWNNLPSIFTINRVDPNNCNNWVTSSYGPNERWLGMVTYNQYLGYLVDADMDINRAYSFISSGDCLSEYLSNRYILDYVARHEYGHYVMFNDVWFQNPSSTMYGGYSCSRWNSVKSYDSNELSSIYG